MLKIVEPAALQQAIVAFLVGRVDCAAGADVVSGNAFVGDDASVAVAFQAEYKVDVFCSVHEALIEAT